MKEDLILLLKKIDALKSEIESMRPLPPEREGRIFQKLRLDWNFHSNAIEGNSLTYGETNAFLMEGLTAKGKPLKDHLDLKGHNEAIDFLRHFIDKNEEITERDIRELHKMILVEPYKSKAISPGGQPSEKTIQIGQYKTQPNHVQTATGEMFYFASPEETPAKMHDLMEWYRANRGTVHPVELAALFHYDFVRIHPFDDGNGRMSRLLMNFILMQFGFPPVVIKASKDKKAEYFYALQMADKGGKDVFVEYIGEQLVHSMEVYLRGARGEDISEADDLDKEIELLFRSFKEDENVLKTKIDLSTSTDFETQINTLLNRLLTGAKKFKSLFIEYKVEIKDDDIFNSPLTYDTTFDRKFTFHDLGSQSGRIIKFKKLFLKLILGGFRMSEPIFNVERSFEIDLLDYWYVIKGQGVLIQIGYGQKLTEQHFIEIETALFKSIIEEIKQKTQKQ